MSAVRSLTRATLFGPLAQTEFRGFTFSPPATLRDRLGGEPPGEGGEEADHAGILDDHVVRDGLQTDVPPPAWFLDEVGDGELKASTEELAEFRGEAHVVGAESEIFAVGRLDMGPRNFSRR